MYGFVCTQQKRRMTHTMTHGPGDVSGKSSTESTQHNHHARDHRIQWHCSLGLTLPASWPQAHSCSTCSIHAHVPSHKHSLICRRNTDVLSCQVFCSIDDPYHIKVHRGKHLCLIKFKKKLIHKLKPHQVRVQCFMQLCVNTGAHFMKFCGQQVQCTGS